uniref:Protein-tyrosine sulfotransferase n=1 Tax=Amblyomma triste TaxID=251400 RepID=A0A023G4M9_AMBTT
MRSAVLLPRPTRRWVVLCAACLLAGFLCYSILGSCRSGNLSFSYVSPERFVWGPNAQKVRYDRDMPLIFIGGMPRSGTTLVRVLLDAHPDVRCGEETRIIPRLLSLKQQWSKSPTEVQRLIEGGITDEVLDAAMTAFILEVIVRHGKPAPRLCNKDPFTLRAAVYLHKLFPHAKFLLMIRDGRAVVHSIITRKVTITGYDLTDYRQCLKRWNAAMYSMYTQCQQLGPSVCMPVYYEQLVLHPKPWLQRILAFLEVPWNDSVLHHEQVINQSGISLSKLERSTDQVIKPINLEALSKWVGQIPEDVVRDMARVAPMLAELGYDPMANPPNYGRPDSFVLNNTLQIKRDTAEWRARELELAQHRDAIRRGAIRHKVEEDAQLRTPTP